MDPVSNTVHQVARAMISDPVGVILTVVFVSALLLINYGVEKEK